MRAHKLTLCRGSIGFLMTREALLCVTWPARRSRNHICKWVSWKLFHKSSDHFQEKKIFLEKLLYLWRCGYRCNETLKSSVDFSSPTFQCSFQIFTISLLQGRNVFIMKMEIECKLKFYCVRAHVQQRDTKKLNTHLVKKHIAYSDYMTSWTYSAISTVSFGPKKSQLII